ncbi:MAG: hypothetical protein P8L66_09165 [Rhodospirillaceae bacterium]|nr:hypothetical protein [Rhodospirillaceae bacterium]
MTTELAITALNIRVESLYTQKDGETGTLLWHAQEEFVETTGPNSGLLIADIITNAVVSVVQNLQANYTPVAGAAHTRACLNKGTGIPAGPYSPYFVKGLEQLPTSGT